VRAYWHTCHTLRPRVCVKRTLSLSELRTCLFFGVDPQRQPATLSLHVGRGRRRYIVCVFLASQRCASGTRQRLYLCPKTCGATCTAAPAHSPSPKCRVVGLHFSLLGSRAETNARVWARAKPPKFGARSLHAPLGCLSRVALPVRHALCPAFRKLVLRYAPLLRRFSFGRGINAGRRQTVLWGGRAPRAAKPPSTYSV